jgi:hypothetical protein
MATTLSTLAASEATMRYQEPFLTRGLNAKLAVNTPPGVYRGFRLSTSGAALSITVVADPLGTDHVAVYQTGSGSSLSIRREGGNFTASLAALASKTVAVCLFATYSVGADTLAEIRAYEVSPSDTLTGAPEFSELVVLGTVIVPASGTIAASAITHDRRRSAWSSVAAEANPWSALVRNSGFEHGVTAGQERYAISDWAIRTELATNGAFRLGTATVRTGGKSLEFNKTATAASVGRIEQHQEIPVVPGQLVRVSAYVRQLIAPTGGSYTVNVYWGDANSTATTSAAITISATGVDASFRLIEQTFSVPASVFVLKAVTVEVINVTSATTGVSVVFEDVQVYLETGSALASPGDSNLHLQRQIVSTLQLEDPDTYALGQLAALLRFDKTSPASEGRVVFERRDQNASGGNLPPAFDAFGRLFLGSRLVSSEARALLARVTAPVATAAGIDFTLLWESVPVGLKGIRIYVGDLKNTTLAEPGLLLTVNARYDGSNWNKDVNDQQANALHLSSVSSSQLILLDQSVSNVWSSSAWSPRFSIGGGEFVSSTGAALSRGSVTFAPLTFTADNITNRFTAVGHSLKNGQGPVQTVNSGGSLPGNVLPATDYWCIPLDADTFQLADSLDKSRSSTPIVISSDGTGVQTLTTSDNTRLVLDAVIQGSLTVDGPVGVIGGVTLAAGRDLRLQGTGSLFLNTGSITSTSGSIVLGGSGSVTLGPTGSLKHGIKTKIISPKMSGGYSTGFGSSVDSAVVGSGAGPPPIASGLSCSLDEYFIFGDRIRAVRWSLRDSATGPTTTSFQVLEGTISTGASVPLGTSSTSTGSGITQIISLSGLTAVIGTDKFHTLIASVSGGNNVNFFPYEVDFDHP